MAKHFLDYNPLTGTSVTFEYDHLDDRVLLTHSADVEPALEKASLLRKDDERTKRGIRNDLIHYAIVPEIIQIEMKQKHGVDFWDPNHGPRVFELLNTEYSRFKTTNINHSIRNGLGK